MVASADVFSIHARFPGDLDFTTKRIEADGVTVSNGALHVFRKGPKFTAPREMVLALAPGDWRSCEPIE